MIMMHNHMSQMHTKKTTVAFDEHDFQDLCLIHNC